MEAVDGARGNIVSVGRCRVRRTPAFQCLARVSSLPNQCPIEYVIAYGGLEVQRIFMGTA